jgi:hypothetical protein
MSENAEISEALMRQLLLEENPTQKITSEAIEAAGFLLRQFVVEARNRASVEVSPPCPRMMCSTSLVAASHIAM